MSLLLSLLVIAIVFSVVVLLPRRRVGGRRVFLLRVLFPSWRFFESIGVVPRFYLRVSADGKTWGQWQEGLQPPVRRFWNVFFNPDGNLYFAQQSAIEHLVSEAEEGGQIVDSSAYAVVSALAEDSARRLSGRSSSCFFQFKISCLDEQGLGADFLISPARQLEAVVGRTT